MSARTIIARVNPDVGWIFKSLAYPLDHTFLFCPYTNDGQELFPVLANAVEGGTQCKLTAITQNADEIIARHKQLDQGMCRIYSGETHHFLTHEKFHYAFCVSPFTYTKDDSTGAISVAPILINDVLSSFRCTQNPQTEERIGQLHLVCLESMYRAVVPAGVFGAVMPKGWAGRNMRYINWLQTEFATIARIELPENAVCHYLNQDKAEPIHLKHELVLFGKAISGSTESRISQLFPFARFRYQPFAYKLASLEEYDVIQMSQAFAQHEWSEYYILQLRTAYQKNAGHYAMRLSPALPPVTLDDPKDTAILLPSPAARRKIQVVASIEEMQAMPTAVHIKVGSRIKLHTYTPLAEGLLLELRIYEGRNQEEGSKQKWNFDDALTTKMFHAERDWLAEKLINAGLIPCLLKVDAERLSRREKWADRQLTPIERTVMSGSNGNRTWAVQFEEIGLRAAYPALIEQWRQRMAKMKMHKAGFVFQIEDVLALVTKNGVMNCNVMGLGKTIEILLAYLLRGNKKCLIVVPSKLIGEWRNEINLRLASYCALARTNWKGENIRQSCDYQVIQWGEDCLPRNLKPINLIAYEKLVRPPKDAVYFYCKKCGTTAASLKFTTEMPCPKCNDGRRQKWQQSCQEQSLRKFWIKCELAENLNTEKATVARFSLGRLKNNSQLYQDLRNRGYVCIDQRPPLPALIMMRRSKQVLIKKQMKIVGHEERHQPVDGKLVKVSMPVMASRKRKQHLKWTFANLLRHRFNFIALDEADYIKNDKAQRSNAVLHLQAKTKIAATGTPVRGFPKSIINLINWTVSRTVFPEYRIKSDSGALKRFYDKYKTEVTNMQTGRKKILPKILNADQFQTEIAPFMLRHTRNEPAVLACISEKKITTERPRIPMDETHRAYYQLWLEQFAEWWQDMKAEEEHKSVPRGEVLIKMGYLIGASTQPHFLLENILKGKDDQAKEWARRIGKYRGPLTAKQLHCFEMLKEINRLGDKALVFSIRRRNLMLGMRWCRRQNPPVQALQIDGKVSRTINPNTGTSPREQLLSLFKLHDYTALWAGLVCMRDGANLPEANHGIFMDLSYEPSDFRQASARMIRPAQEKTIHLTHLNHLGTIDEFISAWTLLKARSVDEGVDFMEFDDFSTDLIPDISQYADCIVDGTEEKTKARMELAIDHIRKQRDRGISDEGI